MGKLGIRLPDHGHQIKKKKANFLTRSACGQAKIVFSDIFLYAVARLAAGWIKL
jgi:hypothetical protein